jgi:hypothetical protein
VPDELVRQLLVFQYGWTWTAPRPEDWPAIQAVLRFHESATAEELMTVQVRLLARESDDEIGRRVGQPPEIIHFYEKLHYNCRDRLSQPGYIHSHFFSSPGVDPTLADVLRRCAYHGGPLVLDHVLSVIHEDAVGGVPSKPKTLAEFDAAIDRARVRAWLALRLIPDRNFSAKELLILTDRRPSMSIRQYAVPPVVIPLYPMPACEIEVPKEAERTLNPETLLTVTQSVTKITLDSDLSFDFERSYSRIPNRIHGIKRRIQRRATKDAKPCKSAPALLSGGPQGR